MQGLEKRGYFFVLQENAQLYIKDKKKTTRISPKGFMTLETFSTQNKNFIKEKKFATEQKKKKTQFFAIKDAHI